MTGAAVKITADTTICIGAGQCVLAAPDLFDQDDVDGTVVVLDPTPPEVRAAAARGAVAACPSGAIRVTAIDGSRETDD